MTKLTVSTTVNAPLEVVWDAMWNPKHIVNWCFASDDWHCPKASWKEPAVWGVFSNTFAAKDGSFSFDLTARYDIVEPMKHVLYTMGEMKEYFLDAGRTVDVQLEKTPEGIKITEIFDAEDINSNEQQIEGWSSILTNFKKYTETL